MSDPGLRNGATSCWSGELSGHRPGASLRVQEDPSIQSKGLRPHDLVLVWDERDRKDQPGVQTGSPYFVVSLAARPQTRAHWLYYRGMEGTSPAEREK